MHTTGGGGSVSVDIETRLNKLAQFVPTSSPMLSLYLNTQSNDRGRDQFTPWIRKEFAERGRAFANDPQSADSFRADQERIEAWLSTELDVAANGVAIFACAAADNFFEAIQLAAPIQQNELHVHDQPHLYPLARLIDQYP